MFITRKHLSRRTILRGVGASLALPLLDSMVPAQTPLARTAAAPRSRLCCIEMVHGSAGSTVDGSNKHYWSPEKEGPDFEFTQTLEPLAPLRDHITVISDTDLRPAGAFADAEEGGDHFRSSSVFLTAAHPKLTMGADIFCGTSIDQLYAQQFGQDTPLPSLQVCIESVDASGHCDYGYACVYSDTISWASPTQPLPMTVDPRSVFEILFGDGATPEERALRQQANGSVLDRILHRVAQLQTGLPASDRTRLNEYLEDVREIERRIQKVESHNRSGIARSLPAAPVGVPDSFEEHVKLMFDLQALAFTTDTTRVSAFKMSRDVCQRVYPGKRCEGPIPLGFPSRRDAFEDSGLRQDQSLPRQSGSVLSRKIEEHRPTVTAVCWIIHWSSTEARSAIRMRIITSACRSSWPAMPTARSKAICTCDARTPLPWPTSCSPS